MARKTKQPKLSEYTQKQVAVWALTHPTWSMAQIAKKYNVTHAQISYAKRLYQEGKLGRQVKATTKVEKAITANTPDALLESQLHRALGELEADLKMPTIERVKLLGDLVNIKKTLLNIKLQTALKRADAKLIVALYEKYWKADATEDEIITQFNKDREQWLIVSQA